MPSNDKRLTPPEVTAFEAARDIGDELLQSIRDMKSGKDHVVVSAAIEARSMTGLSQSQFAELLGVLFGRSKAGNKAGNNLAAQRVHC